MVPLQISSKVVADRLDWTMRMVKTIRELPLDDREAFFADNRNIWTADSCLRRALEALLDLGRHILAKGFGVATGEYKGIAIALGEHKVLTADDVALLKILAGYRNRLVHFYHEVSTEELYRVCTNNLHDIEKISEAYRQWLGENPEKIDSSL